MARLRWGDYAPASPESARIRLVDAAVECFRRYGVGKTTIEDVAAAAKVSRATVYRYFDSRDALILGVLERQGHIFMEQVRQRLSASTELGGALIDGILYTVNSVKEDDHLSVLLSPEAIVITVTVAGASDIMLKLTTEYFGPLLEDAEDAGLLRPGIDQEHFAEWILRIVFSLLTTELTGSRSIAEQRQMLQTFLIPAIVRDDSLAAAQD